MMFTRHGGNNLASEIYSRFDNLRFPLILLVIYLHNAGLEAAIGTEIKVASSGDIVQFLTDMISEGWARVAVPLFFFMSSYLFFFQLKPSVESYQKKWRSRIRTLLIPYLLWNGIVALLFLLAQSIPQTAALFNSEKQQLASLPAIELLGVIYGFPDAPIAYQFWFIRDLMLLVALAPLIGFVARSKAGMPVLGLLFLLWMMRLWPIPMPSVEATLFFVLGSLLSVRSINPFPSRTAGLAGAGLAMAAFLLQALHFSAVADQIFRDIGILGALLAILMISRHKLPLLASLAPASFFLFAMHEPLLTLFRKMVIMLAPPGEWFSLLFYLTIPIIVAAICVATYAAGMRLWPWATRLLAASR